MKKTLIWLFALTLAVPATTMPRAAEPPLGTLPAVSVPNAADFKHAFMAKSGSGEYQLQLIGDKFAAIYDPDGEPVAIFDLSLNKLTWSDIVLGGIGFGDLNLFALAKLIKKAKKDQEKANNLDSELKELAAEDPVNKREDALKEGYETFKDLRFSAKWAERNGVSDPDTAPGVPFAFGDFTMSDIEFPSIEARDKILDPFSQMARTIYPEEEWTSESLAEFANEFEFKFVPERPGYDVVWKLSKSERKKKPRLPGVVVNYLNPFANLIYKYKLSTYPQWGELLIRYFGIYGKIMDLLISRVCQNLIERLDYHENQLLALMEAAERFEYEPNFPTGLIDPTVDAIYLNKFFGSKDPNIANGMVKRKLVRARQEANRVKAQARLDKIATKQNLTLTEFGGGKFTVARHAEDQSFRGIYSLALKPIPLAKFPSLHVNAETPAWKIAERYTFDLAGYLSRILIPNTFALKLWIINIGIRIPPDAKDDLIRSRLIAETDLEGEMAGLLDEALAGRYALPLSFDEAALARKRLRQSYINPWKLDVEEEKDAVAVNLKRLEDAIHGASAEATFSAERLVPINP